MPRELPPYKSRAARALILLHEDHLREFVTVWRKARDAGVGRPDGIPLPVTNDPDYASLDSILSHVFATARTILYWLTENLGLPDPEVEPLPDGPLNDSEIERHLNHLCDSWATPMADKSDNELYEYITPTKPCYASAMLEHAVMHPIRHAFQLEELMGNRG